MNISVVIPAYNEEKYIASCLRNIVKHSRKNLIEILVVDNASTDNTAKIARKFKNVKVVREDIKGLTRARQKGLVKAKGDLIAYIDADTMIPEKWFDQVNKEFNQNKKLVCLSGPYIYYDLPRWKQNSIEIYNKYLYKTVSAITKSLINGGNFVASKEALLTIGGFDITIPFYSEDINIARRLKKVGKVKYSSKLYVFTSARRLVSEGILKTGARYAFNFMSQYIFGRPLTKKYKDIR